MTKTILILGTTVLVAGLVIVSCKKDGSEVFNGEGKHVKSSVHTFDKSVYDEVGRKHNELLDLYDYDRINLGIDDAARYFDSILFEQGYYSEYSSNNVLELFRDANGEYYDDFEQEDIAMRSKYNLFGIDSVIFSAIIDRFYDFTEELSNNITTKQEALAFIDAYEHTIDGIHMSNEERTAILTSIYLSRHSINYWMDETSSNKEPHNFGVEKKKKKKGSFWKKIKCTGCVVAFDAAGGMATAVGGPWSALAGAAALSLYAQYCICPSCDKYGSVKCK